MYWCAELLNQHQQVGSLLITHQVCCMMRTCPAHRCHLPATLSHGKRNKAALRGPFHMGLIPLMTSQNLLTSQRPHPWDSPTQRWWRGTHTDHTRLKLIIFTGFSWLRDGGQIWREVWQNNPLLSKILLLIRESLLGRSWPSFPENS